MFLALKEVAAFTMQKYTQKYGKAMNLLVRDGVDCIVLQQSRTTSIIDYVPPLGSKLPFYACAGGKILLSELSIELIKELISSCEMKPLTEYTIVDAEKFLEELEKVSKQKFAFDDRESSENGSCVAVAVRDKAGTVIAALSFSGFINIDDVEELKKYVPVLNDISKEISDNLFSCFEK